MANRKSERASSWNSAAGRSDAYYKNLEPLGSAAQKKPIARVVRVGPAPPKPGGTKRVYVAPAQTQPVAYQGLLDGPPPEGRLNVSVPPPAGMAPLINEKTFSTSPRELEPLAPERHANWHYDPGAGS